MNLFASFIFKGVLILLKDVLIDTATPHIIPDDIHSDSQVERLVGGKVGGGRGWGGKDDLKAGRESESPRDLIKTDKCVRKWKRQAGRTI